MIYNKIMHKKILFGLFLSIFSCLFLFVDKTLAYNVPVSNKESTIHGPCASCNCHWTHNVYGNGNCGGSSWWIFKQTPDKGHKDPKTGEQLYEPLKLSGIRHDNLDLMVEPEVIDECKKVSHVLVHMYGGSKETYGEFSLPVYQSNEHHGLSGYAQDITREGINGSFRTYVYNNYNNYRKVLNMDLIKDKKEPKEILDAINSKIKSCEKNRRKEWEFLYGYSPREQQGVVYLREKRKD